MWKAISAAAVVIAVLLVGAGTASAGPTVTPLVSSEWLEDNLTADDLLILDIRSLDEFEAAHIPGSHQTAYPGDWNTERDGIPSRIPLVADLEAMLSSIGIGPDISVVLVPAGTNSNEIGSATWIYWVLKYLGHDAVAILIGGWAAWDWEGRTAESGAVPPAEPRTFVASPRPELIAETDYVAERVHTDAVIIDARPPPHYTGAVQGGLVTRPGHIPGALSLDNALFYDSLFNQFKELEDLEAQLPEGLTDRTTEIISYCAGGHWGSINWFVLHELLVLRTRGSLRARWRRGREGMIFPW